MPGRLLRQRLALCKAMIITRAQSHVHLNHPYRYFLQKRAHDIEFYTCFYQQDDNSQIYCIILSVAVYLANSKEEIFTQACFMLYMYYCIFVTHVCFSSDKDKNVSLVYCDSCLLLSLKRVSYQIIPCTRAKKRANHLFFQAIPLGNGAEVQAMVQQTFIKNWDSHLHTDFMKYSIYSSFWRRGHVFQTTKTNVILCKNRKKNTKSHFCFVSTWSYGYFSKNKMARHKYKFSYIIFKG